MSTLTDEQVVRRLATREGWSNLKQSDYWYGHHPDWCSGNIRTIMPQWMESLDALQPVLATLTEAEWSKLDELFKVPYAFGRRNFMKSMLTMPPETLAHAIAEVLGPDAPPLDKLHRLE